jgi:hypothetical protein
MSDHQQNKEDEVLAIGTKMNKIINKISNNKSHVINQQYEIN